MELFHLLTWWARPPWVVYYLPYKTPFLTEISSNNHLRRTNTKNVFGDTLFRSCSPFSKTTSFWGLTDSTLTINHWTGSGLGRKSQTFSKGSSKTWMERWRSGGNGGWGKELKVYEDEVMERNWVLPASCLVLSLLQFPGLCFPHRCPCCHLLDVTGYVPLQWVTLCYHPKNPYGDRQPGPPLPGHYRYQETRRHIFSCKDTDSGLRSQDK